MSRSNIIDDKYCKKKLLGKGSYGTVWEAEQLYSPFERVAVKLVSLIQAKLSDERS